MSGTRTPLGSPRFVPGWQRERRRQQAYRRRARRADGPVAAYEPRRARDLALLDASVRKWKTTLAAERAAAVDRKERAE